jgi:hypothetical protein
MHALRDLASDFLKGELSAVAFEARYLAEWNRWRDDGSLARETPEARDVYNRIFTSLDVFCSDPALRNQYSIDEHQLRIEVKSLLEELAATTRGDDRRT